MRLRCYMAHKWGYPIINLDDEDSNIEASIDPNIQAEIHSTYVLVTDVDSEVDGLVISNAAIAIDAANASEDAEEVADHFHTYERWLGKLAVPAGGKVAAEATLTPFQVTSGNNTWGTAIQVLDTNDVPLQSGKTIFDPHRIMVVDASASTVYRLRIAFGATYAAAITAGTYSGFMFRIATSSRFTPIDIKTPRIANGTKVWVAVWNASNGATVDFFIGLHEYV